MANFASQPASAVNPSNQNEEEGWGHIVPDADGSLAFASREEAERFADEHGIAKTFKGKEPNAAGKQPEHDNIIQVGTSFVIGNPGHEVSKQMGTSETVASGSDATSDRPMRATGTNKSRSPQSTTANKASTKTSSRKSK